MAELMEIFIILVILTLLTLHFIYVGLPLFKGAPYVPTSKENLKKLVKIAELKKDGSVVDLGSGDGRVVMEFAKSGYNSCGYEINPLLVLLSRYKIRKAGLTSKALIIKKDFWKEDLSKYDLVVLFQVPYVMKKLEKKLKNELKPGSKVLSYSFEFPDWGPITTEDSMYLYEV
jgi:16S rRNA A1518/A1519 N6-dimethyltransferase RsmA/KsgA/DIM1 with predicted DNA glycosylase/AP lyase activity